jgi:hypothetical protein
MRRDVLRLLNKPAVFQVVGYTSGTLAVATAPDGRADVYSRS